MNQLDYTLTALRDKSTSGCVIDVGAHLGKLSVQFAESTTGTVHAIEACDINYAAMCKRICNHPTIKPHHLAITGVNELVTFHAVNYRGKPGSSQCNSLFKEFVTEHDWVKPDKMRSFSVRGVTVDQFCVEQHIDHIALLKFNCEGGEYKVFDGDALAFLAITDMIWLDLHGKTKPFTTQEFIQKRIRSQAMLKEAGFILGYGDTDMTIKGHVAQVWRKADAN